MTRHVCDICGYSLDDAEYEGALDEALAMHIRIHHLPLVIEHYDIETDTRRYRLCGMRIWKDEANENG